MSLRGRLEDLIAERTGDQNLAYEVSDMLFSDWYGDYLREQAGPVVHLTTLVQKRREWDHHAREYYPEVYGVRVHYEGFIECESEDDAITLAGKLARVRLVAEEVEE